MEESEFGERLKAQRIAKKLSQDDVAKAMGKQHRTTISNWEKGKQQPSLSEIRRLAELLDTTVGYLVNGEESTVPKGFRLVEDDQWDQQNRRLIELQEELIKYQKKELARTQA
ncbi:helix-turn-helix domain-containing protein [Fibrella sp. WM1]|uniref:helix-turn-helix domain-containing protein n=1 Tax=Fibrella musci TaxID=3242485 RepID=UPI00352070E0